MFVAEDSSRIAELGLLQGEERTAGLLLALSLVLTMSGCGDSGALKTEKQQEIEERQETVEQKDGEKYRSLIIADKNIFEDTSSGKQYKSHAATIYKWALEDIQKTAPKKGIPDYSTAGRTGLKSTSPMITALYWVQA